MLKDLRISVTSELPYAKEFNFSTHCITGLFLQYLGEFDSGEYRKIDIITTVEDFQEEDRISRIDNVIQVQSTFDFESYFSADILERKTILIDCLYDNLIYLSKVYGWSASQINKSYKNIKNAEDLELYVAASKPLSSPNRKLKAQLVYHHTMEKITLFAWITNKEGEHLYQVELVTTKPHEWFIAPYLGKLKWLSNNSLQLIPKAQSLELGSAKIFEFSI